MKFAAVLILALALSACARKNDPVPPEGAVAPEGPRVTAPSLVTDPFRRGRRL